MASFDPKALGIDSKADTGLFLFVGGLGGAVDGVFNFAASDPLTVGTMFGIAAVGAKKMVLDRSGEGQQSDKPENPPPPASE